MSYVKSEKIENVSVITLNNPDKLNAISTKLLTDFELALNQAIDDDSIHVIVLTGAGRAFCSGDDLTDFDWDNVNRASVTNHINRIQRITYLLMGCDKPVIGAIHGYAVGGGFEWLMNCDLVVASDDLVAFFPEFDWGFFVTGGVTALLPRVVGNQKAMELFLLGERQSSQTLYSLGIVNRVVPLGEHVTEAISMAKIISKKSRFSVSQLKKIINLGLNPNLWQSVQLEEKATIDAFLTPEAMERVQTFKK